MARGGERLGRPGAAYSNRTDLAQNPIKTAPAPAPALRSDPTGAPAGPSLMPLDAPTQRPNEPVTAGAPVGPGPGPEVIGLGGEAEVDELRRIYQAFPSEALRQLIEESE